MNDRRKHWMQCKARCELCGRIPSEHIWRCLECGDPMPTDDEGFPIFEGHGLLAALTCPVDPLEVN